MTKHKYLLPTLALVLVALFTSACSPFYDDLSQCRGTYLAFSYHADDDETVEHLPEYLHRIDLFIYNEQNALVERHVLTQETLDRFAAPTRPSIMLDLAPGSYRAVAVGNLFDASRLVGESEYNASAQVLHKDQPQEGGGVSSGYDSLYLGECSLSVVAGDKTENLLIFYSQHVQIDARLSCADKAAASAWYTAQKTHHFTLTMGAMPSAFALTPYTENPLEGIRSGSLTYQRMPLLPREQEHHFALQYNILRFNPKDAASVVLHDGETALCSVDFPLYLSSAINAFLQAKKEGRNYHNSFYDCDRQRIMQEAVIPIYFIQKPVDMTVTIAPWSANQVSPSF